jgi:hypothetical protein
MIYPANPLHRGTLRSHCQIFIPVRILFLVSDHSEKISLIQFDPNSGFSDSMVCLTSTPFVISIDRSLNSNAIKIINLEAKLQFTHVSVDKAGESIALADNVSAFRTQKSFLTLFSRTISFFWRGR